MLNKVNSCFGNKAFFTDKGGANKGPLHLNQWMAFTKNTEDAV